MKYLVSILRIFVLVAVVLAIANFSDIKKAKAASGCTTTGTITCTISENGSIDNDGGTTPVFHLNGVITNKLLITNKPTTITGNITVTTYGSLTFTNLTITNGAKVTQEAIAISDLVPAPAPYNMMLVLDPAKAGSNKKVDLTVTGKLSLINNGRIDVAYKGFPGGIPSHHAGYGFGGGCPDYNGGSYGGYGGNSYTTIGGCALGWVYGSENAPTENGSGGGAYHDLNGKAGGGIIYINAGEMYLDHNDQTFISANGDGPVVPVSPYYPGGGAGGSIWIIATKLTSSYSPAGSPSALGNGLEPNAGSAGTVKGNPANFGQYITANGGGDGGGGGRINIYTASNPVKVDDCRITSGDQIPAVCEGQDVTVSGTTIDAGKIKVWQEDATEQIKGDECGHAADSDSPNCDSKRHFNSLTIKNNAILTHEAITIDNMYLQFDNSLADETTGTARWKKVDIDVGMGTITLNSGGKIDVSGKGYPGGVFPVGGMGSGKSIPLPSYVSNAFGTGQGGISSVGNGGSGSGPQNSGGGGSFAGRGAAPVNAPDTRGNVYNYSITSGQLEFGSGGQAIWAEGDRSDWAGSIGGAGGGRIMLNSGTINIDVSSSISANGGNGTMDGTNYTLTGGGGSGGAIVIYTNTFNATSCPCYSANVSGGINLGTIGKITNPSSFNLHQLNAIGGHAVLNGSGWGNLTQGAGGGGGWIVLGPGSTPPVPVPTIQSKKIEVTVTWKDSPTLAQKTVKVYDDLRSVVAP